MKNRYHIPLIIVFLVVSFQSCGDFVANVDPLSDIVEGDRLNSSDQTVFFLNGVKGALYRVWEYQHPVTETHGDATYGDERVPGDIKETRFMDQTIGSADIGLYNRINGRVQELRNMADQMIERLPLMNADGLVDDDLYNECLWWGYLMGGISRQYLAEWFGLKKDGSQPGSVISPDPRTGEEYGSFLTPNELFTLAEDKYKLALSVNYPYAGKDGIMDGDHAERIVWSFLARLRLHDFAGGVMGDAENIRNSDGAREAAGKGLIDGDPPFVLKIGADAFNIFYYETGRGRQRMQSKTHVAPRFARYVVADRKEGEIISAIDSDDLGDYPNLLAFSLSEFGAEGEIGERGHSMTANPRATVANPKERIQLREVVIDLELWDPEEPYVFGTQHVFGPETLLPLAYSQDKYVERSDDMKLIEWQEMELILAELDIYDSNLQSALDHINTVRASHDLDPKTMDEMINFSNPDGGAYDVTGPIGLLIEERDKELFLKSVRTYDQFRFGIWHLRDAWPYFPMAEAEVNANPNIDY